MYFAVKEILISEDKPSIQLVAKVILLTPKKLLTFLKLRGKTQKTEITL